MSFTLRDKTEIKIFILYLLMNAEEPVDFVTLHDMVVQDAVVGQFDFMDSFFELAETAAIQKIKKNDKEFFTVTPSGRDAAKMLETDLSRSVRESALRSAKRYLQYRKRGTTAKSAVIPLEDGRFRLDCECRDREGVFMSASVVLDSKRQAELMKYNFDDRTELIYRGLLSLLSGDVNYLSPSWDDGDSEEPYVK